MAGYLLRRIPRVIVVVWGAVTVIFLLQRLSGDPVHLMLPDTASQDQLDAVRADLGLDKPVLVQYLLFIGRFARLDFGQSYLQHRPVADIVFERLPYTLELAGAAVLIATVGGTLLGAFAARMRRRWPDKAVVGGALIGQSVPTFWLGIVAILVFSVTLRWFPSSGSGGLSNLVLPAVTLGAFSLANTTRIARASMIESLSAEYTQTAHAKGLGTMRVVGVHALKNSGISILTLTAYTFSTLMGGALVTEVVFAWPGVGRLMVDGVLKRDFPVVQGAVFVVALIVVVTYLLLDLAYTFLDPRLRRS
ncbi:ABC transporter permease [Actinophytocola oryzae]|uniref:Peptide/nickel transport system permease protein n=1 Tax=Actinophytocola oryzae TaxID=502181 RepID=A0A4R7W2W9_9PSEU|nr:ABC transporter permease [Actinophytocola oryzae]TDV56378.1 peptide/nickel transport system permease protein [Actinophytocola oryzae]